MDSRYCSVCKTVVSHVTISLILFCQSLKKVKFLWLSDLLVCQKRLCRSLSFCCLGAFHQSGRPLHRCHQDLFPQLKALRLDCSRRHLYIHQNHNYLYSTNIYKYTRKILKTCFYPAIRNYTSNIYCQLFWKNYGYWLIVYLYGWDVQWDMVFYYKPESNPFLEDYEARISRIPRTISSDVNH